MFIRAATSIPVLPETRMSLWPGTCCTFACTLEGCRVHSAVCQMAMSAPCMLIPLLRPLDPSAACMICRCPAPEPVQQHMPWPLKRIHNDLRLGMRRWNNVLSDSSRQMVIELFLGLRLSQHLPSLHQRLHYPPPGPPEDADSDADEPYERDGDGFHSPQQVRRPCQLGNEGLLPCKHRHAVCPGKTTACSEAGKAALFQLVCGKRCL